MGAATYGQDLISSVVPHGEGPSSRSGGRIQGPAMPPGFDLTLAREQAAEHRDEERTNKRKRDKTETKERIEEMVGPKPVGREGMLEKKKLKRENDRDFREKGDEGLEIDEKTLMGGGDSFKAQYDISFPSRRSASNMCFCFFLRIARRDMAKRRYEQKNEEKNNAIRKRASEFKEKEKVRVSHGSITVLPLKRNSTGYHGYVPTIGETAIRIKIRPLPAERVLYIIIVFAKSVIRGCFFPAYSDYRYYDIQVNIVHSRFIRLGGNVTRQQRREEEWFM